MSAPSCEGVAAGQRPLLMAIFFLLFLFIFLLMLSLFMVLTRRVAHCCLYVSAGVGPLGAKVVQGQNHPNSKKIKCYCLDRDRRVLSGWAPEKQQINFRGLVPLRVGTCLCVGLLGFNMGNSLRQWVCARGQPWITIS